MDDMIQFYKDFGVGKLGLHKAFRIAHVGENVEIIPITNIPDVRLSDLVGYEIPKQKLIDNTKAFVEGKKANNCLLFGDAGTGKSSSIKGILNEYYDQGLRMIEVYKHQFQDLNELIAQIKNRNYKFIIYMDDLSFEEFEIEYKYLKAVIEGGLEKPPGQYPHLCDLQPPPPDQGELQRQRGNETGYAHFRYGTGEAVPGIPLRCQHLFRCAG